MTYKYQENILSIYTVTLLSVAFQCCLFWDNLSTKICHDKLIYLFFFKKRKTNLYQQPAGYTQVLLELLEDVPPQWKMPEHPLSKRYLNSLSATLINFIIEEFNLAEASSSQTEI